MVAPSMVASITFYTSEKMSLQFQVSSTTALLFLNLT